MLIYPMPRNTRSGCTRSHKMAPKNLGERLKAQGSSFLWTVPSKGYQLFTLRFREFGMFLHRFFVTNYGYCSTISMSRYGKASMHHLNASSPPKRVSPPDFHSAMTSSNPNFIINDSEGESDGAIHGEPAQIEPPVAPAAPPVSSYEPNGYQTVPASNGT